MKKYELSVTVQHETNFEEMTLLRETFNKNIIKYRGGLRGYLKEVMPNIRFTIDDGKDVAGSDYCQYVCRLIAGDKWVYILAEYNESEE